MVAIFLPAFILPLASMAISVFRYWRAIGGKAVSLTDIAAAFRAAASMRNLAGGHGEGCNFEDTDRFSNTRRYLHHAVLYGFLACFAATCAGTVMHYGLNWPAPYGLFTLPKLLGVPGGLALAGGAAGLAVLKFHGDRTLGDARAWRGELGFVLLLFFVSASGLALYAGAGSSWLGELLALHLGSVLAFFLLMPFTKMAHGLYRLAALARDHQQGGKNV